MESIALLALSHLSFAPRGCSRSSGRTHDAYLAHLRASDGAHRYCGLAGSLPAAEWREFLGLLYHVGWSRVVIPKLTRKSPPPLPPLPGAETRGATALMCVRVERPDYT